VVRLRTLKRYQIDSRQCLRSIDGFVVLAWESKFKGCEDSIVKQPNIVSRADIQTSHSRLYRI
jgi:hypothetical protein